MHDRPKCSGYGLDCAGQRSTGFQRRQCLRDGLWRLGDRPFSDRIIHLRKLARFLAHACRAAEGTCKLQTARKTVLAALGKGAGQHWVEAFGKVPSKLGNRLAGVLASELEGCHALEGASTSQCLKAKYRQRVDVRSVVDRRSVHPLLRGHIVRGADVEPTLGKAGPHHSLVECNDALGAPKDLSRRRVIELRDVLENLCNSKIQKLGQQTPRTREHHHVCRFEIAVDDALIMGGLNHFADPIKQGNKSCKWQGPLPFPKLVPMGYLNELPRNPPQSIRLSATPL